MTYLYRCQSWGEEFEVQQAITDAALTDCPLCRSCVPRRLIASAPALHFNAGPSGGWSNTGYSKPEHERRAEQTLGRKLVKAAR